jgi:hypothetical protein
MTSKVFLFDKQNWLYCSGVSFKEDVWRGWVENGAWHLVYNTIDKSFKCYRDSADERADYLPINERTATLTWMCDPIKGNYNAVIADAKQRYENQEQPTAEIGPDRDYELFLKLKAKYENDNEYDLYLELKERYDDDEVPF